MHVIKPHIKKRAVIMMKAVLYPLFPVDADDEAALITVVPPAIRLRNVSF